MPQVAINEQGASVHAEGDMLHVKREGRTIRRVRLMDVDQLLLFGRVELSSGAVSLLARRNVDVVFCTLKGAFRARLTTRASKNVSLRLAQMRRAAEPETALRVARAIATGKILHQRQILLRAQRKLQSDDVAEAVGQMRRLAERAQQQASIDVVRGLEGQAAALYFRNFGRLIRSEHFTFTCRTRRPPRDPINAALSFGYALLTTQAETTVLQCGLEPMVGFFHQPAYGRPSLVLDLIEEFRPLIDALVLRMVNRRQLGPSDFQEHSAESLAAVLADSAGSEPAAMPSASGTTDAEDLPLDPEEDNGPLDETDNGQPPASGEGLSLSPPDATHRPAVYLADSGRRVFLGAFFERMRERMFYPPREQTLELRQIVQEQVYHLARVIENKDNEYTPFVPR
ncbi:MAG: CRISPR-associated endonuclease Cas1 [Thermoguttaceae bacterium]|jgi:CRISPR-associated protein Cas1|nr:CRISPR-associated endonuclease Cas1 [Thermoguttaceae bacterium]